MPTVPIGQEKDASPPEDTSRARGIIRELARRPAACELLIFAMFVALTALMTWPWVLHLPDAVADTGDPYMIAWSLWWNYHQTFSDPLHLFHANIFYPYQYTLAFSENDWGIAFLFFPLFAAGFRPLTVHSVATFLGFAFCGYAMFRLARTLTDSNAAGWVAGVFFAFIPFRFHLLSHLHYLFAGWIPLVLEALVLYARVRSWRRAAWLGTAFLMNALTCISWFILTLIPLALTAALLVTRDRALLRERAFWLRAGAALAVASMLLVPFLLPYYWVSVMYGLKWQKWEFAFNSPSLIHWVAAERRNKLWGKMGAHIPGGHKLFPGLLAPLLALAALRVRSELQTEFAAPERRWQRWLGIILDAMIVLAAVIAVFALGYGDTSFRVLGVQLLRTSPATPWHALAVILVLLLVRVGLGLAQRLRRGSLGGWLRGLARERRDEVIGVGLIWLVWGFLSSLGASVPVNRLLHDYVLLFQSLRFPSRGAMICYVGLALLAGAGTCRLIRLAGRQWRTPFASIMVALILVAGLLFELRAFPLQFELGAVEPDALALRLKWTDMRGGLVELPSAQGVERHYYMLRAADHGRPLVNATASFISPVTFEINKATQQGAPGMGFLDLLESIPTSYLVIHNESLGPEQRADYEGFVARAIHSGRLRFINRFDDRSDLYAVTKTEPDARGEAAIPFRLSIREWAALVEDDPVHMLGQYQSWSQMLYRIHLASKGQMPRYAPFRRDVLTFGRGVIAGFEDQVKMLEANLRDFAEHWTRSAEFKSAYDHLDDSQFVDRLLANAGVTLTHEDRASLINALSQHAETRGAILLKVASDPAFAEKENYNSLVLLHYFGYFQRNPDDPPDNNMNGFLHWRKEIQSHKNLSALTLAFAGSVERKKLVERSGAK